MVGAAVAMGGGRWWTDEPGHLVTWSPECWAHHCLQGELRSDLLVWVCAQSILGICKPPPRTAVGCLCGY